jgi:hypothetical protein
MIPTKPDPVKLIIGLLYSDEILMQKALEILSKRYGKIDYTSDVFEFTITDYYVSEMGNPIFRCFVSFSRLIYPNEIADVKIKTNKIEKKLSDNGKRKVNLDPGYMDYDKVVLASAKYNGQKIYLDFGIWADLVLHYENSGFDPYPWSFPDFKQGMYNDVFLQIRQMYKLQRKKKKYK